MRTPKEYTQNLKQKIITKQMLADCLYSVNKRAKNCRDNEHKYSKYRTDYYGNADNYRQQKEEYYSQKDKMLTLLKPNCIHETTEYHKERVYDYEPEYYEIYDSGNYLRSSGYYDKELHEYVEFVVVNVPHGISKCRRCCYKCNSFSKFCAIWINVNTSCKSADSYCSRSGSSG